MIVPFSSKKCLSCRDTRTLPVRNPLSISKVCSIFCSIFTRSCTRQRNISVKTEAGRQLSSPQITWAESTTKWGAQPHQSPFPSGHAAEHNTHNSASTLPLFISPPISYRPYYHLSSLNELVRLPRNCGPDVSGRQGRCLC